MIKTIIKHVLAIVITAITNYIACYFIVTVPLILIPYLIFRIKLEYKLVYIIGCSICACVSLIISWLLIIDNNGPIELFFLFSIYSMFITVVFYIVDLLCYLIIANIKSYFPKKKKAPKSDCEISEDCGV